MNFVLGECAFFHPLHNCSPQAIFKMFTCFYIISHTTFLCTTCPELIFFPLQLLSTTHFRNRYPVVTSAPLVHCLLLLLRQISTAHIENPAPLFHNCLTLHPSPLKLTSAPFFHHFSSLHPSSTTAPLCSP